MNILLDTHIFLWALSDPRRLGRAWRRELETALNRVYLSAVCVTEIMIKVSLGKLKFDFNPVEVARASGFELLEFSAQDALPLATLPFHHRDPFDRMLIAQAVARDFQIMTSDHKFSLYDARLVDRAS